MRKQFLYGLIAMMSLSLMSGMCSSDDDGISNNSEQIAQVENIAQAGTWRITTFIDSGQDETDDFSGYEFTFNPNGSLTATNSSNTLNGTWSVTADDDGSDDDGNDDDDIDFNIFFPVPDTNDFEELNDDWDILSRTTNRIELADDDNNNDLDLLIFERN
jgi:hypothetical protein